MERPLPKRDRRWSDPYLPLRPTELMPCLAELMSQWDCLGGGALPVVPIAPRVMSLLSYLLFYLYFAIITYYFVYLSIYIVIYLFLFTVIVIIIFFFSSFPYLFNLF